MQPALKAGALALVCLALAGCGEHARQALRAAADSLLNPTPKPRGTCARRATRQAEEGLIAMEAFVNELWDATRPALLSAIASLAPILATNLNAKIVAGRREAIPPNRTRPACSPKDRVQSRNPFLLNARSTRLNLLRHDIDPGLPRGVLGRRHDEQSRRFGESESRDRRLSRMCAARASRAPRGAPRALRRLSGVGARQLRGARYQGRPRASDRRARRFTGREVDKSGS